MNQTALAFDDRRLPAAGPAAPAATRMTQPPAAWPSLDAAADPMATGQAIGWDHARHALVPPVEHLLPGHPVREGWEAGRSRFGAHTRLASRATRRWLQLRLLAWQQGRCFEEVQVTPNFLAQIDTERCPVTRQVLSHDSGADSDAEVVRVFQAAGYAAGNLATLSRGAGRAKGDLRWDDARLQAVLAESRADGQAHGLGAAAWSRLSVLMSFVTPLPHELAATLPLLVLPPNRLRLLNPIQGLQALITRQLMQGGYAARIARLVSCLPGQPLRRDFHLFFHGLLPRAWDGGRAADAQALRERLEDAWRNPMVLRRWQRFAGQLSAEQAQALLDRAVALGLGGVGVQHHADDAATDGWALASGGLLPAPTPAPAPAPAQARPVAAPRLHLLAPRPVPGHASRCHT